MVQYITRFGSKLENIQEFIIILKALIKKSHFFMDVFAYSGCILWIDTVKKKMWWLALNMSTL